MSFDAVVNGVHVRSNKTMDTIAGALIKFTDGSWYNANTGESHNAGPGYIDAPGRHRAEPDEPQDIVTRGPEQTDATALRLARLDADVVVEVYNGRTVSYTITGPAAMVGKLRIREDQKRLVIQGPNSGSATRISTGRRNFFGQQAVVGRGAVFQSGRDLHVVSSGDQVNVFSSSGSVSIGDQPNPLKIKVQVPVGAPVDINDVNGKTAVGNTHGPLTINLPNEGRVAAGQVDSLSAGIDGSGRIRVDEVRGKANVRIDGSGRIDIGHANGEFVASIPGSGRVTLSRITAHAIIRIDGSGEVLMDEGIVPEMTVGIDGSGRVEFGGTVTNAALSIDGSGRIHVNRVTGRLRKGGDTRRITVKYVGPA